MNRLGIPRFCAIPLLLILFAMPFRSPAQAPTTAPLRLIQTIPLRGVAGPIGHLSADVAGRRLFVAALGNNSTEIVDLRTGRQTASIANLAQPQGILFEKDSRRLFVSCSGDGTCKVFDAATSFPLLASIPVGGNPGAIHAAPGSGQVIIGYGAGALGFFDVATLRRVTRIGLAGHPEGFAVEINGARIFANIPDTQNVAVVDRNLHIILGSWPLVNLSQNYPLALDEAHSRLFIGCRYPPMLQIFDSGGGAIDQLATGADADDVCYDARHTRIYVSCGGGRLDVIKQSSPDYYQYLTAFRTPPGARTSLFDPDLDRLFVGVPGRPGHDAEIWVFQPLP